MSAKPKKTEDGGAIGAPPTRALDRGLRVLEAVAAHPNSSLAEIAEIVDLSPPTTLRILETLRSRDFVSRAEPGKVYSVGLKAFEVGSRFLSETRLQETSQLLLQRLAGDTGQTATLSILQGNSVVYIDVVKGTGALRSSTWVGAQVPAHATASGKALLAWKWEAGLIAILGPGPYAALTEQTITSLEDLTRELAEVRGSGVAFDREELNLDITCVAAPVRDRTGEIIAAFGVQGLTRQFTGHETTFADAIRAAADEASQRLGWRPNLIRHPGDTGGSALLD